MSRCMRIGAVVLLGLVVGCGDDQDSAADSGTNDGGVSSPDGGVADASTAADASTSSFSLTSAAFSEGGAIPVKHACAGDNVSPPLAWSGAPSGAKSYAIVFTDLSNGLIHSVIWDIPAARSSLPEDVEKAYEPSNVPGAKQTRAYSPSVRGYLGPCPSSAHNYEFEIFAVDMETLPGMGSSSTREQVKAALPARSLDTATLGGTYDPN